MSISLTINGKTLQAEPEMTVLEAARAHGIYIPTLCYLPDLRPPGGCRMCIVHIKGMPSFPTACTVPVSDGMVVNTETEAVQKLRREILALLLSEHPYTCLVCENDCSDFQGTVRKAAVTTGCQFCPANGQCELQELVDYLELKEIPYPITYRGLAVEQDDPFFDRDYNLCILCGRCVRVCQDVRHAGVLSFIKRGNDAIVGTAFGRSHIEADCQFCGACVDVCPTGALFDKRGKWEGVPSQVIPSVCPLCSVGCAVNIQVKNDQVIRAVGRSDGPTNAGQLCVRGRFGVVDVVHSLSRLKAPMIRRNGRHIKVSWDEALGVVAQNLSQFQPDQFAAIGSATASNEDVYTLQKFARSVMHSNNVALSAGFPEHDEGESITRTVGTIGQAAIRDVRNADTILCIGTNVLESHPILGLEIIHALSQREIPGQGNPSLVVLDARQTRLAQEADVWLQPRLATDHLLLAGLIKALAEEDCLPSGNATALASEALAPGVPELAEIADLTGVSRDQLVRAARHLAGPLCRSQDQPANIVIIYGSGVTHHPTAPDSIQAIQSLARVLGNARILGTQGEGNLVGAYDMGMHPALLPGYLSLGDPTARNNWEDAWNVSLNPSPGRNYQDILEGIRAGQIRALYLAGETPPLPEFSSLEFLVVQDIVSSEITQHAHVVLPTVTFAEMDGTMTNLEGRVQRLYQAIPPVGSSRPGWMIMRDLARSMRHTAWDYQSAAEIMDEIAELVPAYSVARYDNLDGQGALRQFDLMPQAQAGPFDSKQIPQLASEDFPMTLITERNLLYYHGACLIDQVAGLNLVKQEEVLRLNAEDIRRLGVSDGGLVNVISPYGSTTCIVEVADGMLPEGIAFASFNRMKNTPLFPTLAPSTKAYPIRIEVET